MPDDWMLYILIGGFIVWAVIHAVHADDPEDAEYTAFKKQMKQYNKEMKDEE